MQGKERTPQVYEPPRIEPVAAFRGPQERGGAAAGGNVICNLCSNDPN